MFVYTQHPGKIFLALIPYSNEGCFALGIPLPQSNHGFDTSEGTIRSDNILLVERDCIHGMTASQSLGNLTGASLSNVKVY